MSSKIKNLIIVESPAKAHTISGYLGQEFEVMASVGHIRSIAKDTKEKKAIDTSVGGNFETVYEIDTDKTKTVRELKKAAKEVLAAGGKVYLASDEDREGEAIAWHLAKVLGLSTSEKNRVTYTEITKTAVLDALKNPRALDMDLVKAQQARQILDRLVGFELSPVVWKKVPGGKSAGRVQSPAVKLLVEREREIVKFDSSFVYKTSAIFAKNSDEISAKLNKDFANENDAREFLESLKSAQFTVAKIAKTDGTRNPMPPFTTSTLQQDANARLGMSARSTMSAAQSLYQQGHITYMRTDSMNLSNQFLGAAGNYISRTFGDDYLKIRKFHTKTAGAQEAHEAIRPTDPSHENVAAAGSYEQRLYNLIRSRTLASQMASAKIARTNVEIEISEHSEKFVANGSTVVFSGFLKVYGAAKDEILPELTEGEKLDAGEMKARQTFAKPPARYTEGSLVKKLEELEIGRPSTYATIISTIQNRGYAEKGDGGGEPREFIEISLNSVGEISRKIGEEKTGSTKGKLVPTPIGSTITDFINEYFADIDDYKFTAKVESELDQVAEKKLAKEKMLRDFYDPFHEKILGSDAIERSAVAGAKKIGDDPKTGEPIFARVGRFGPMLVRGDLEAHKDDKSWTPVFANFPKGKNMENIDLASALKMFELPRVIGKLPASFAANLADEIGEEKFAKVGGLLAPFDGPDGAEIFANIGRFGPYVALRKTGNKTGGLFVSLGKTSPFDETFDDALAKIREKILAEANKTVADFGEIKILNGRWGAYITDGKKNAKIDKEIRENPAELAKITEAQARKILEETGTEPGKRRFGRGRKTAKTAAKKSSKTTRKTAKKTVSRKAGTKKPVAKKRKSATK